MGDCLGLKYGQPLSTVFKNASDLKRAYEFLANPKTSFAKLVEPFHHQSANNVRNLPIILAVGDTTFLDYKKIEVKRSEYGPIGNGGNGLILHTSLAVDPDCGQPLGLLWEKVWKRPHTVKPKKTANKQQKKNRELVLKKEKRARPFEEKESYKWVEAVKKVPEMLEKASGDNFALILHVFDREGDISEVFEEVRSKRKLWSFSAGSS